MCLLYFCPNNFCYGLFVTDRQPKTEALTRSILKRYPEIARKIWSWKKKEGLSCGSEKIKFASPNFDIELHSHYPGKEPHLPVELAKQHGYNSVLNPFKGGVEIRFDGAVPSELTEVLKAYGFRYSGTLKLWWAKQTPETIRFAKKMKG